MKIIKIILIIVFSISVLVLLTAAGIHSAVQLGYLRPIWIDVAADWAMGAGITIVVEVILLYTCFLVST